MRHDPSSNSTAESCRKRQQDWFATLQPGYVRTLFEHLPYTLFFAKNREGRLMAGNQRFVERCGFSSETMMIGHLDADIFPLNMAAKYRADDLQVMKTGEPLINLVELFPNREGIPEWYITDKIPLFDQKGRVAGVCGTVRSYEGSKRALQPYLELLPVVDYLKEHYAERLSIKQLARMSHLSLRQLERKFRDTFKTTPQRYIQRLRILAACDLLRETSLTITEIALRVGFYDHSAFSRQFAGQMGMPPRAYRKKAGRP